LRFADFLVNFFVATHKNPGKSNHWVFQADRSGDLMSTLHPWASELRSAASRHIWSQAYGNIQPNKTMFPIIGIISARIPPMPAPDDVNESLTI
jgi:hypothetical protein